MANNKTTLYIFLIVCVVVIAAGIVWFSLSNSNKEACIKEGGTLAVSPTETRDCCGGLKPIGCARPDTGGQCPPSCFGASYCTKCGDGVCGKGENICNCSQDCKALDVNSFWENRENYIGKEIILTGKIEAMNPRCTENVCAKEDPCCQSCGLDLGFVISKEVQILFYGKFEGKEIGCTGTNCKQECYPFEAYSLDSSKNYTVKIILKKNEFSRYYMELIDIIKPQIEEELCIPSEISDENLGSYELMELEKCDVNGITVYKKSENTRKVTDSGRTTYYDEKGNKICRAYWFYVDRDCNDKLKTWNPDFIIENCEWEKICSKKDCATECKDIPFSDKAPKITESDLNAGWYYGQLDQKKPGTPEIWFHAGEGMRSAMWYDPAKYTGHSLDFPCDCNKYQK